MFVNTIQQQLIQRINLELIPKIERCINLCTDSELCYTPNEHSNSITNLIYHLNGNVRQWLFQGVLDHPYDRNRPLEFTPKKRVKQEELFEILYQLSGDIAKYALEITKEDLERTIQVQVYSESGLSALIHVIEHFSYHTGQIALLTKLLKNKDLGFYSGLAID